MNVLPKPSFPMFHVQFRSGSFFVIVSKWQLPNIDIWIVQ